MEIHDPPKPVYVVPTAGQRGMTTLHHAAYLNDPDLVRQELQRGIPVDCLDDGGWTPLHWSIDMAEAWGEPEVVVAMLLEAGASPNAVNHAGDSVLMVACERNNIHILMALAMAGADIHQRSATSTPLHAAVRYNFEVGIECLLLLGADPSLTNSDGLTSLQLAEENESAESIAVLKKYMSRQ